MVGGGPERFSESQRAGLDARQFDQDRTLAAVHRLEAALGSAASRRQPQWHQEVLGALADLDEATSEEATNAERPDSLLSDIARTQPRLRSRVHGVRAQYRQVRDSVTSLRQELQVSDPASVEVADLRQRLALVTAALRHQRARESDLIYEGYYEAFHADLGQDSGDGSSS